MAFARPLRLLERRRPEVDPGAAGGERRLQRGVVADAPAHLDLHVELADDAREQLAVGAAAERGVEVDEVDPLGAVGLPLAGRLERVAVGRLGAGLALDEADGLPVGDVDGGQQDQAQRELRGEKYRVTTSGRASRLSRNRPSRWRGPDEHLPADELHDEQAEGEGQPVRTGIAP